MKILQRMELSTHVFLSLALDGDGERKKERKKKEREKEKRGGGGGNRADPTGGLHAAVNIKSPATYIN